MDPSSRVSTFSFQLRRLVSAFDLPPLGGERTRLSCQLPAAQNGPGQQTKGQKTAARINRNKHDFNGLR